MRSHLSSRWAALYALTSIVAHGCGESTPLPIAQCQADNPCAVGCARPPDGTVCVDGEPKECTALAGQYCESCGCPDPMTRCAESGMCEARFEDGHACISSEECQSGLCDSLSGNERDKRVCLAQLGAPCTDTTCAHCMSDGKSSYCGAVCNADDAEAHRPGLDDDWFFCITDQDTNQSQYRQDCIDSQTCKLANEECTASGSQFYGNQVFFCNPVEDTSTKVQLDFVPSNLGDINGVELTGVRDLSMCDTCVCNELVLNTDDGTAESNCTGGSLGWTFKEIPQKDGPSLGVFFMRTLKMNGGRVEINGSRPAVLVAQNRMEIGTVLSAGGGYQAQPSNGDGFPGVGAGTAVGEAGSYCSAGGLGANQTAQHDPVLYGTPEIVPLLPGSAGKLSVWNPNASDGGGAIQLVAGKSIRFLGSNSGVWAWGGYGDDKRGDMNVSGGGGSGGAILIEAPEVLLEGQLAANGGDGGGGEGIGGLGAGGENKVGQDGKLQGDVLGGGGGGFGRIRINTRSGKAVLKDAYISPSAETGCFTEGKLHATP